MTTFPIKIPQSILLLLLSLSLFHLTLTYSSPTLIPNTDQSLPDTPPPSYTPPTPTATTTAPPNPLLTPEPLPTPEPLTPDDDNLASYTTISPITRNSTYFYYRTYFRQTLDQLSQISYAPKPSPLSCPATNACLLSIYYYFVASGAVVEVKSLVKTSASLNDWSIVNFGDHSGAMYFSLHIVCQLKQPVTIHSGGLGPSGVIKLSWTGKDKSTKETQKTLQFIYTPPRKWKHDLNVYADLFTSTDMDSVEHRLDKVIVPFTANLNFDLQKPVTKIRFSTLNQPSVELMTTDSIPGRFCNINGFDIEAKDVIEVEWKSNEVPLYHPAAIEIVISPRLHEAIFLQLNTDKNSTIPFHFFCNFFSFDLFKPALVSSKKIPPPIFLVNFFQNDIIAESIVVKHSDPIDIVTDAPIPTIAQLPVFKSSATLLIPDIKLERSRRLTFSTLIDYEDNPRVRSYQTTPLFESQFCFYLSNCKIIDPNNPQITFYSNRQSKNSNQILQSLNIPSGTTTISRFPGSTSIDLITFDMRPIHTTSTTMLINIELDCDPVRDPYKPILLQTQFRLSTNVIANITNIVRPIPPVSVAVQNSVVYDFFSENGKVNFSFSQIAWPIFFKEKRQKLSFRLNFARRTRVFYGRFFCRTTDTVIGHEQSVTTEFFTHGDDANWGTPVQDSVIQSDQYGLYENNNTNNNDEITVKNDQHSFPFLGFSVTNSDFELQLINLGVISFHLNCTSAHIIESSDYIFENIPDYLTVSTLAVPITENDEFFAQNLSQTKSPRTKSPQKSISTQTPSTQAPFRLENGQLSNLRQSNFLWAPPRFETTRVGDLPIFFLAGSVLFLCIFAFYRRKDCCYCCYRDNDNDNIGWNEINHHQD